MTTDQHRVEYVELCRRNKENPLFLQRNLKYNHFHRKSRVRHRKGFSVNECYVEITSPRNSNSKNQSRPKLNLCFTGSSKDKQIDISLFLTNNRKNSRLDKHLLQTYRNDTGNVPSRHYLFVIDGDKLQNVELLFNVGNGEALEETQETQNIDGWAALKLFDHHTKNVIPSGKYCLVLFKDDEKPTMLNDVVEFSLAWEKDLSIKGARIGASLEDSNSRLPSKISEKKKRKKSFMDGQNPKLIDTLHNFKGSVRYVPMSTNKKKIKKSTHFQCYWCNFPKHFFCLKSLLLHLQSCHDTNDFTYEFNKESTVAVIRFSSRTNPQLHQPTEGTASFRNFYTCISAKITFPFEKEFFWRRFPSSETGISLEELYALPHGKLEFDKPMLSSAQIVDLEPKPSSPKKKKRKLSNSSSGAFHERLSRIRTWYHSDSYSVMSADDLQYDSEKDIDKEWFFTYDKKMLDDIVYVNQNQKHFFILWNQFVHSLTLYADHEVPNACEEFAKQYGKELLEKNLKIYFVTHLFYLFDFGLITSDMILKCLSHLSSPTQ